MAEHTIANKCITRLLRANVPHFYDKPTIKSLWEEVFDELAEKHPKITQLSLAELIVPSLTEKLVNHQNSLFLTVSDLKRSFDPKIVKWRYIYLTTYPLDGKLAFQGLSFSIDKKAAFCWGKLWHETPLVLSRHAIDRLFIRCNAGVAREDAGNFMFYLKIIVICAAAYVFAHGGLGKDGKPLDKIPVPGGHFPLIYEADKIVLATFIDDGLYLGDQEAIIKLSAESEGLAGGFLGLMEGIHNARQPITLGGKQHFIRRVTTYFPNELGLRAEKVSKVGS